MQLFYSKLAGTRYAVWQAMRVGATLHMESALDKVIDEIEGLLN